MDEPRHPADGSIVDRVDRIKVVDDAGEWCFACGARAYVFARMPSGKSVSYCGHHGTAWWAKLNEAAVVVIDLRHTIIPDSDD